MALPAAVRKQVDQANALIANLHTPKEDPQSKSDGQDPSASVAQQQAPNGGDPVSQVTPPSEPAPSPAPTADPDEGWQHKYNVLQGKYNAEVPRLTKQVREQSGLIGELRQRLTNTETQLASLGRREPAKAPAPATPPERLVKDDEIREFGADMYDFVKRAGAEVVAAHIQKLEQRLAAAEARIDSASEAVDNNAEAGVIAMLHDQVPDWEEMNVQPEFLDWLKELDPYAGRPRQDMLLQAYQAHDGPRVVAFFKGFKNENAVVTPPSSEPAPAPTAKTPKQEGQPLDALVAPGNPKSGPNEGAPSDTAGKRVWSRPDIQQLYAEINEFTKKARPVPKELRALEADLIKAQAEGRVRQ